MCSYIRNIPQLQISAWAALVGSPASDLRERLDLLSSTPLEKSNAPESHCMQSGVAVCHSSHVNRQIHVRDDRWFTLMAGDSASLNAVAMTTSVDNDE